MMHRSSITGWIVDWLQTLNIRSYYTYILIRSASIFFLFNIISYLLRTECHIFTMIAVWMEDNNIQTKFKENNGLYGKFWAFYPEMYAKETKTSRKLFFKGNKWGTFVL